MKWYSVGFFLVTVFSVACLTAYEFGRTTGRNEMGEIALDVLSTTQTKLGYCESKYHVCKKSFNDVADACTEAFEFTGRAVPTRMR